MGDLSLFDADEPVDATPDVVSVHAGFPNPAADQGYNPSLSLEKLLIIHPSSTYYFRISGNDWQEQGIYDGDIAIIDRALSPRPQDLVICWQQEQFAILPAHKLASDQTAWGVVASVIHRFIRKKV